MLNEIIFLILAAVIIVGAFKMLAATEPVHAAIYLGLVLFGVAGIYLTLGAEFLAAIQVLVYVGAVVTLILFAVMLTTPAETTEGFGEDRTPLNLLGIEAPRGMDIEALQDVPSDVDTVADAEHALEGSGAPPSAAEEDGQAGEEPAEDEDEGSDADGSDDPADEDASDEPTDDAPDEPDVPSSSDADGGGEEGSEDEDLRNDEEERE